MPRKKNLRFANPALCSCAGRRPGLVGRSALSAFMDDIEEHLIELREWHEEGLVNDVEYSAQVMSQLQRLPRLVAQNETKAILLKLKAWRNENVISESAYVMSKTIALGSLTPGAGSSSSESCVRVEVNMSGEQGDADSHAREVAEPNAREGGGAFEDSDACEQETTWPPSASGLPPQQDELCGAGEEQDEEADQSAGAAALKRKNKVARTQTTLAKHFGMPIRTTYERIRLPQGSTRKVVKEMSSVQVSYTAQHEIVRQALCSRGCGLTFALGAGLANHQRHCSGKPGRGIARMVATDNGDNDDLHQNAAGDQDAACMQSFTFYCM